MVTHIQNQHFSIFQQIADSLDIFKYGAVAQILTMWFIVQLSLPCRIFSSPFTYVLIIRDPSPYTRLISSNISFGDLLTAVK